MNGARRVRVALPGFADAVRAQAGQGLSPRLPAAEWLVARGAVRPAAVSDWRAWLLTDAGLGPDVLRRFPAGPCTLAAEQGAAEGTWARAEPVHLLTALDHLQLAAPAPLPIAPDEAEALLSTLNRHLAGTGFRLRTAADDSWLCECPPGLEFAATEPGDAIGRNLRDVLPAGRDAVRAQALVTELQMLLHEHPVNERRAARGLPPVNSVWLWGVGGVGSRQGAAAGLLTSDDAWLSGLWRLHGGAVRPVTELRATLDETGGEQRIACARWGAHADRATAAAAIEASLFEPLRAMLAAGHLDDVQLHVGSCAIDLRRGARWRFWRRARPLAEVLE